MADMAVEVSPCQSISETAIETVLVEGFQCMFLLSAQDLVMQMV